MLKSSALRIKILQGWSVLIQKKKQDYTTTGGDTNDCRLQMAKCLSLTV